MPRKPNHGDVLKQLQPFGKVAAILLTLLAIIIPVVMAYGALVEKVDHIESQSLDQEKRIIILEKIAAGTEVSLESIKEDVSEIKSDVKKLMDSEE